MYDLRNIKGDIRHGKNNTVPIIKYSGHVNNIHFGLGFDVSPNGSILAAGNSLHLPSNLLAGDDCRVRLWSVNTGERIHARVSETPFDVSENPFETCIAGLKFSHRNEGLWVAGEELEYWSI
jgi:WD40 repeat protein